MRDAECDVRRGPNTHDFEQVDGQLELGLTAPAEQDRRLDRAAQPATAVLGNAALGKQSLLHLRGEILTLGGIPLVGRVIGWIAVRRLGTTEAACLQSVQASGP
jgi:hypothetical protein